MSKQLKHINRKHLLILMGLTINTSFYAQSSQDYYASGNTKYLAGDYKGSIQDNTKAIELNSTDAKAYYIRGEAKNQLLDYKEAIVDYSKAVVLNPKYARAYIRRGNIKTIAGDFKEAIMIIIKA